MFETKKTLIVVYKDEMLMNQLKKLVETHDDDAQNVVGTRDDSINIVSWTEKVWLGNKKAGNIQGKILYLGDIKGTDKLIPVVDLKFDECGVRFGWAGNQAVVYADPKVLLTRDDYDVFLEKLSSLPVPDFLKTAKENIAATGVDEDEVINDVTEHKEDVVEAKTKKKAVILKAAGKAIKNVANATEKVGSIVASKSEELFRNKNLMKRQMLFYGVVNLYNNGLEEFMNM